MDPLSPLASVIVFQYNPETLTRSLSTPDGGEGKAEVLRLKGAPEETVTLDVEIDATDQLTQRESSAATIFFQYNPEAVKRLLEPQVAGADQGDNRAE